MANVILKDVNKIYPNGVQAVFDFNLEIKDKEFIVFVGPSGCGKSTTLRMIAGLEEISSGELYIDGELMNEIPPKDRGIAMVFQSYALYPQMTVFDNMAFGLKLRHVPKDVIKEKIEAVAATLGLTEYLYRKPKALSGGQRQRVALGRAIAREAKVYLFDEPLSNLDAKLRVHMRTEIAKIHKSIGATSIYVTHDQIEAMTMASRIVVMKDGHIQQIGEPTEIYAHPSNMFVGGFIGTPPMSFINGFAEDGYFYSTERSIKLKLNNEWSEKIKNNDFEGKPIALGLRPENLFYTPELVNEHKESIIHATIDVYEVLGHQANVYFNIEDQQLIALVDAKFEIPGNTIDLAVDMDSIHLFDLETTNVIK